MSLRPAQLALRLDASPPDSGPRSRLWQDGATVSFLGAPLTLRLDTQVESAMRLSTACGAELHLPLPPQASERQVQDSAEAWLRHEAEQFFQAIIAQRSAARGLAAPRLQLSFAARGGWTEVEAARTTGRGSAGRIKCNWRLIEQAPDIIEQVLAGALASVHASMATPDLFGSVAA